ncbi:MAG: alpha-amylase/4-alpha-glucanotransferase domain-containing protein [Elusimicrobiota bacterium]
MKKINFIFGVHNHQPVGNFDNVFEWATKQAYQPFLDVIEKHPSIKIVFHYTGCLIDWFEKNNPEMLARIRTLVEKGQAEVLTGGYYEPILPIISDSDKFGQIKKLSNYIKEKFFYTAKGMWLAERIWEPSIAKILNEAGVEYIVLDDSHFLAGGIEEKKLRGYFITEEQGAMLKIFPISQYLRYAIPFADPQDTIEYLKSEASDDPSQLLVIADDGEKFGIWPDTYKTCYEKKWLEKFITLLEENSDWINVTTFSQYLKEFPAKDRVYLPTISYSEMSEWTLPSSAQVEFEEIVAKSPINLKRFLKGGFWRNFLTKYSESNQMHKKMLYVSEKIDSIIKNVKRKIENEKSVPTPYTLRLTSQIQQALNLLYKAQCNCAYWHGVFGGLYLPHLRHAIYKNLIEAEVESEINCLSSAICSPQCETDCREGIEQESQKLKIEVLDFDKDGQDEIIITNNIFNVYAKPSYGGTIFEIDFKPARYNLTDVLTRRLEAYHKRVEAAVIKSTVVDEKLETIHGTYWTKELELQKHLKYDWYNRYSLIDHFFHPSTTLEKFANCEYSELGDFVDQSYKMETGNSQINSPQMKPTAKKLGTVLKRDGHLWTENGAFPIQIVKSIIFANSNIIVEYKITNNSSSELEIWFGSEFNFSFSNPNDEKCFYCADSLVSGTKKEFFSTKTSFEKTKCLKMFDRYNGFSIDLETSDEFDFWVFPIWTVSLSESGFEKTYQGSSITPNRKIFLKPNEVSSFEIKISCSLLGE